MSLLHWDVSYDRALYCSINCTHIWKYIPSHFFHDRITLVNISSSNMFRSMIRNNVEYGMQMTTAVCRVSRDEEITGTYWYRYHEPSHHPLLRSRYRYT